MKTSIQRMKLSELIPTENNPRQIKKEDFERLKKSLKSFPKMLDIREIVVDENNRILGGHQRVKALMANGETEVNVKVVEGLSEDEKREFIIRDNVQNGASVGRIAANEWIRQRKDYEMAVLLDDDYGGVVSSFTTVPTLSKRTFYKIVKATYKLGKDLGIITGGYSGGAYPKTKKNIMNIWFIDRYIEDRGLNMILNEDVCYSILNWHRGKANFGISPAIRSGAQTAEMDKIDGNTKLIYATDRSYRKSFGAILADPRNSKLTLNTVNTKRGALWHHKVSWSKISPMIILQEEK